MGIHSQMMEGIEIGTHSQGFVLYDGYDLDFLSWVRDVPPSAIYMAYAQESEIVWIRAV